ncbi:MAG: hypothetical protein Q7S22_08735 [Candidatus Micrarchaeota archaeon]|nr:hypothetical protein [Candidatus Micrarchaeota archaeon]
MTTTTRQQERMRGPNLKVIANCRTGKGVLLEDAVRLADAENLVIASSKRIQKSMPPPFPAEGQEYENYRMLANALPCFTGTAYAYMTGGIRLDDGALVKLSEKDGYFLMLKIGNKNYFFPVPEQYRQEGDILLVMNHPDFRLVTSEKDVIFEPVDGVQPQIIRNFPGLPGCYSLDETHAIPTGKNEGSSERAYFLARIAGSNIGLVARAFSIMAMFDEELHPFMLVPLINESKGLSLIIEAV